MNKKGQSISINTIIIAAIALAVLVVLFVIFTGRIGLFSKGIGEGEKNVYACVCSAPGEDRVCAFNQPADKISEVSPTESQCGGRWTDCLPPQKCYK